MSDTSEPFTTAEPGPGTVAIDASATAARLDTVAQVLIATVAAVSGLLALLGANSDRVWALLDDDGKGRTFLLLACACAVLTIFVCLWALVSSDNRSTVRRLMIGACLYVLSLLLGLYAISEAADRYGRPTFSSIAMRPDSAANHLMTVRIRAEGVDPGQVVHLLLTRVDDVERPLMTARLNPSSLGVVDHTTEITISDEDARAGLRLVTVNADNPTHECPGRSSDQGPACVEIRGALSGS